MIKIELNKELFSILKKYVPEGIKRIENIEYKKETVSFEVSNSNMKELRLDITDVIVEDGMDNQEVVNEIGKNLYWLYDEIRYQEKKQRV